MKMLRIFSFIWEAPLSGKRKGGEIPRRSVDQGLTASPDCDTSITNLLYVYITTYIQICQTPSPCFANALTSALRSARQHLHRCVIATSPHDAKSSYMLFPANIFCYREKAQYWAGVLKSHWHVSQNRKPEIMNYAEKDNLVLSRSDPRKGCLLYSSFCSFLF